MGEGRGMLLLRTGGWKGVHGADDGGSSSEFCVFLNADA
jgi:hypothetical protein